MFLGENLISLAEGFPWKAGGPAGPGTDGEEPCAGAPLSCLSALGHRGNRGANETASFLYPAQLIPFHLHLVKYTFHSGSWWFSKSGVLSPKETSVINEQTKNILAQNLAVLGALGTVMGQCCEVSGPASEVEVCGCPQGVTATSTCPSCPGGSHAVMAVGDPSPG